MGEESNGHDPPPPSPTPFTFNPRAQSVGVKLQSIGSDSISRTTPDRRRAEGKWRMSRFPLSQPPSPQSHFANYLESALNRSSSLPLPPFCTPTCTYTPRNACSCARQQPSSLPRPPYFSSCRYYAQLPPLTFPPNAGMAVRKVSTIGHGQIITVSARVSLVETHCLVETSSLENTFIHPPIGGGGTTIPSSTIRSKRYSCGRLPRGGEGDSKLHYSG